MTDINNNNNINKINSNLNFEGIQPKEVQHTTQGDVKEVKNLDNAHSALIGRTLIHKADKKAAFSGALAKGIKEDLGELKNNPKAAAASNAIFEAAMAKGYSYEQAANMSRIAFEDFQDKA